MIPTTPFIDSRLAFPLSWTVNYHLAPFLPKLSIIFLSLSSLIVDYRLVPSFPHTFDYRLTLFSYCVLPPHSLFFTPLRPWPSISKEIKTNWDRSYCGSCRSHVQLECWNWYLAEPLPVCELSWALFWSIFVLLLWFLITTCESRPNWSKSRRSKRSLFQFSIVVPSYSVVPFFPRAI